MVNQVKQLPQVSHFFEVSPYMILQTVIKLHGSFKKNVFQHPNYVLYHSEILKLEIEGTKHGI